MLHREMKIIRWGIVGCGDVTEVKSGPGFQKAVGSALVAVMRRDAARAEDYARRHRVPRWYSDADALVRDPEVDAVYVATPPSTHLPFARLAAAAGKPVYVEKPMALDHAGCVAMIDACGAAKVPLFTAYYRRAMPRYARVKALVEDGVIGEIRAATICVHRAFVPPADARPWRIDPAVAGGGLFVDLASHQLDLLDWILGPVVERPNTYGAGTGITYLAEHLKVAWEGLVVEAGARPLLHALLQDAEVHGGRVESIVVASRAGLARVRARAFVDAIKQDDFDRPGALQDGQDGAAGPDQGTSGAR